MREQGRVHRDNMLPTTQKKAGNAGHLIQVLGIVTLVAIQELGRFPRTQKIEEDGTSMVLTWLLVLSVPLLGTFTNVQIIVGLQPVAVITIHGSGDIATVGYTVVRTDVLVAFIIALTPYAPTSAILRWLPSIAASSEVLNSRCLSRC